MYIKPFGSLFGESPLVRPKKPGYLGQGESPTEELSTPVIPTLVKRYKAEPKHPKAKLLIAKHEKKANEQKIKVIKKDIKKLQRKKTQLESLIRLLDMCRNLTDLQVQEAVDKFERLSPSLDKIERAKQLKLKIEQAQDRIHLLETKIEYFQGLKDLKEEGIPLEDRVELQSVTATSEFRADTTPDAPLPIISAGTSSVVNPEFKAAVQDGLKSAQLGNSDFKAQVKKVITELPPKVVTPDPRLLEKEIEKSWVAAKEFEYKLIELKKEKEKLEKEVSALQEQAASSMLEVERLKPRLGPFVKKLSLLTELKPSLIEGNPSLIAVINSAFRGVSKLEDIDADSANAADLILEEATNEANAVLNELAMREYAVEKLQAEIEGRPLPSEPSPQKLITMQAPSEEQKLFKTLVKIAPVVLGALVLIKVIRG